MPKPKSARRYLTDYAIDLALAYVLAVIDVAAILIPLRGHTSVHFEEKNLVIVAVLVVLSTIAVAIVVPIAWPPHCDGFSPGGTTQVQREAAMKLAGRQTATLLTAWAFSGAVMALINRTGGAALLLPMLLGVLLGGPAAAGTGLLLAQRSLRPIMTAATREPSHDWPCPGCSPDWF